MSHNVGIVEEAANGEASLERMFYRAVYRYNHAGRPCIEYVGLSENVSNGLSNFAMVKMVLPPRITTVKVCCSVEQVRFKKRGYASVEFNGNEMIANNFDTPQNQNAAESSLEIGPFFEIRLDDRRDQGDPRTVYWAIELY